MIKIGKLNLSSELVLKLNEKKIKSISKTELEVFNAVANGSNVVYNSLTNLPCIVAFIKKFESSKKLKPSRKPKLLFLVESKDLCESLSEEIRSLITKELIVVSIHNDLSKKKCKKRLEKAVDIIVGTTDKINQLNNSDILSLKNIKHIVILNLEKMSMDHLESILTSSIKNNINPSTGGSNDNKSIQLIVSTSLLNESIKSFVVKQTNGSYSLIGDFGNDNSIESNESSDESVQINGHDVKIIESDEVVENGNATSPNQKEIGRLEVNDELLSKIRGIKNEIKHIAMSKLIIDEFGDVCAISKLIGLCLCNNELSRSNKAKPVHSGSGSKFTGREGYTAYHFVTNKEVAGKGYLFRSLKRLIEEDTVEKIERIQMTKDSKGFVFDLPSEFDETFQNSWMDGKFDSMELLEDEIPELINSNEGFRRRSDFGSHSNSRGGYQARMNDRGGRGTKRSESSSFEKQNSKLIKFD